MPWALTRSNKHVNCWSAGIDPESYSETKKDTPKVMPDINGQPISVDHCIAEHVRELIKKGIPTMNSCCGHNGGYGHASIIIDNPTSYYAQAREILDHMHGGAEIFLPG